MSGARVQAPPMSPLHCGGCNNCITIINITLFQYWISGPAPVVGRGHHSPSYRPPAVRWVNNNYYHCRIIIPLIFTINGSLSIFKSQYVALGLAPVVGESACPAKKQSLQLGGFAMNIVNIVPHRFSVSRNTHWMHDNDDCQIESVEKNCPE